MDNIVNHLDLLFFHRRLRRLVAIKLKVGDFKPDYKGQMELYLRWLDKYERQPNEESPIGIILCTGKNHECIELLELDKAGTHVAEYLATIPSKEELLKQLKQATKRAKKRLAIASDGEWDCALWIGVDNPEEVERLVWKEIRGNKWVEKTDTHWAKKYW